MLKNQQTEISELASSMIWMAPAIVGVGAYYIKSKKN
jgi:hypothetical protein